MTKVKTEDETENDQEQSHDYGKHNFGFNDYLAQGLNNIIMVVAHWSSGNYISCMCIFTVSRLVRLKIKGLPRMMNSKMELFFCTMMMHSIFRLLHILIHGKS